jgi:hypothetical protein
MTQTDRTTPIPTTSTQHPTVRSATRRILELVISWASQSPKATMILRSHPNQNSLRRKTTLTADKEQDV